MFKMKKSRKNDAAKIILGIFGAAAASIVIALAISKKEEIENFFSDAEKEDEKESEHPAADETFSANGKTKKPKKVNTDSIENNLSHN